MAGFVCADEAALNQIRPLEHGNHVVSTFLGLRATLRHRNPLMGQAEGLPHFIRSLSFIWYSAAWPPPFLFSSFSTGLLPSFSIVLLLALGLLSVSICFTGPTVATSNIYLRFFSRWAGCKAPDAAHGPYLDTPGLLRLTASSPVSLKLQTFTLPSP